MGSEFTGDTTMDAAEKRLNELGYKQELRREMTMFKTLAISFSTMTLFTGITPLYGSSLQYAGPASLVWGWVVVSFFTWFVGIAMAEICSSFPTTGSLYFWAAHLAGPKWGPFSSWCCAWLETIGLIAGIGTQAYAGSQTLQSIILLSTGTHKGGGYFAPKWLFLCMYIGLTVIWAALNTFALEVIALIDMISIWWQLIGGIVIVIMLPLVSLTTQSASYVFTHLELAPESTGITSKPYAVILAFLVSQYSLFGYDAAAHLTEETKGADKNGPIAILGSIGMISVFGWAYILALTFSIQNFSYLYDTNNETAGVFVPAQILYDAFHGRYHNSIGAIILLFIIWGSFFFGGLSITTSAARVMIFNTRIWRTCYKHQVHHLYNCGRTLHTHCSFVRNKKEAPKGTKEPFDSLLGSCMMQVSRDKAEQLSFVPVSYLHRKVPKRAWISHRKLPKLKQGIELSNVRHCRCKENPWHDVMLCYHVNEVGTPSFFENGIGK
ncbi:amino-acid permease BAT1 homolog [Arachis hypogaea]|uniref:amino-acid permease BAT1 homolog n=1 Tax=Arachis hypogaea TaxID=3818 RepID=UPI000DEE0E24|nr:amino-acid permease BAT1 homolog [Arachis hypogaea]